MKSTPVKMLQRSLKKKKKIVEMSTKDLEY